MNKITTEGFVDGLSNEDYHSDCCDSPSLSHSGAHKIVTTCPAKFWAECPANPNFDPEDREEKKEFDIGTAVHLAILEPDQLMNKIEVITGFADYRKKDAQEWRDDVYAAGKTPLLEKHRDQVFGMMNAIHAHPIAKEIFKDGVSERSYFRKDPVTGVWLKCRPDFLRDGGAIVADVKTSKSAHPGQWNKRLWDMGHYSQVPWYSDMIHAISGVRPRWYFILIETDAPFLITVATIPDKVADWGRLQNRVAIDKFAECLRTGDWHGYRDFRTPDRDTAFEIDLPKWASFQLQDKHEAGEFEKAHLSMSQEFMRPPGGE